MQLLWDVSSIVFSMLIPLVCGSFLASVPSWLFMQIAVYVSLLGLIASWSNGLSAWSRWSVFTILLTSVAMVLPVDVAKREPLLAIGVAFAVVVSFFLLAHVKKTINIFNDLVSKCEFAIKSSRPLLVSIFVGISSVVIFYDLKNDANKSYFQNSTDFY
jgi:hypothetical protein